MSSPSSSRRSSSKFALAAAIVAGLGSIAYWYRRPIATWQRHSSDDSGQSQITRFLPTAEFAGEVSVVVHAPAEAIFAAMKKVTLADMPIANWLGHLRYLPGKFLAESEPEEPVATVPFLQVIQVGGANIVLTEIPNREIVFGAVGKFHNLLDQQIVPLAGPSDFVDFNQPDYQKLAMSFLLTRLPDDSGHRLSLIHGTHGLSDASRSKFALYWLGIKPGGNFVSWLMLRAIRTLAERETDTIKLSVQK